MTASCVIGVDGGGSKTTALLAGSDGAILGRGVSGPSNYQAVGAEAALAALEEAVIAAWKDSSIAPQPVQAVCLGMAGVDRPEDHRLVQSWAEKYFSGAKVEIVHDARLALAAGTSEDWGLVVISGTGSLIYGRDYRGNAARAGGWGYLLGDEGSGYAIGLQALRAVARAQDGRGPQTALVEMVLTAWGLRNSSELIRRVYGKQVTRADIGRVAILVEQAASQGDLAAQDILTEAGRELALGVKAVAEKLRLEGEIPCALAGGSLVKGRLLADAFRRAAETYGLQLEPVRLVAEPALGAVRIALAGLASPSRA